MKIQLSTLLLILLLTAIIGLLGQQSCIHTLQNRLAEKCPEGVVTTDTTKVKDSSNTRPYVPQPTIAVLQGGNIEKANEEYYYHPVPTKKKVVEPMKTEMEEGTNKASDYFYAGPFFYSDTVRHKYGTIIINDTTEGRILSRNVITDFDLPVVTNTHTITLKEPARVRGYLSLTAQGNQRDLLQSAGGGFMLQFKNYNAVEVQALYNFRQLYPGQPRVSYQVSYKPLISFRKN